MRNHEIRQTSFCLCVDDFGVKYFNREDMDHLLNTLGTDYKYTVDWTGCNFCGLKFGWNYKEDYTHVSIPGYVKDSLM